MVKLFCAIVGEASSAFPVNIAETESVGDLKKAIKAEKKNALDGVDPDDLQLFLAKSEDGAWLELDEAGAASVALDKGGHPQHLNTKLVGMGSMERINKCVGKLPDQDQVHVLVKVPLSKSERQWVVELPPDKFDVKRQRVEHSTSLAELWEHSEFQLEVLPAPHQLVELLQKPLPFKLTLRDLAVAKGVFNPDGPLLICPDLTLLMDNFLHLCSFPPQAKASENSWQEYYDALLRIPNSLCRAKGFWFRRCRNLADRTGTTILRNRPDYILQYKGLVLLRGEENSSLVQISTARAELTSKMRRWNVMFYGDLPYILGYATSGDDLQVVAIERSDGPCRATEILNFSIFEDKAGALKVFYNLALLLHQMAKLTKRSYACNLEPFVPDENEKRKIVLLDGFIERTIKRTLSGGEMDVERLKSVYETLQGLDESSPVTHLQTVEKLSVKRDGRLVVELSPIGYVRLPTIDELSEWLRHMLTALKYWHGCGYCHGDIRWRNIVLVPASGFSYWVLIDMDEARQPNTTIIRWNHQCNGHKLRFQHDLCQLGHLMEELPFELSYDQKTMQAMLLSAVDTPDLTAKGVLATLEEHF